MRLAWLTDIHLNFVDALRLRDFLESIRPRCDAVAISGDVAESPDVVHYLQTMEEVLQKPIYFVLGNHNFYRGSIAKTRLQVADCAKHSRYLNYLTALGVVELTAQTAIVGHDGWADGRLGDLRHSNVILSDHQLIAELSPWFDGFRLDKSGLLQTMTSLADEAARHFETVLEETASRYANVIAVTHVPPFREAAWYQGRISGDEFLPHFASKVVGDVMRRAMQAQPNSNLLVLCGHTHGGGEIAILDNLRVLTGEAEYGRLRMCRLLDIE